MTSDFPWVESRAKCSAFEVFKELQMGAEGDAAIRHEQMDGKNFGFRFQAYGDDRFVVYRNSQQGSASVEFRLTPSGISAKGESFELTATIGLNDEGGCRLRIGAEELQNWQFRKRALEDLFFKF